MKYKLFFVRNDLGSAEFYVHDQQIYHELGVGSFPGQDYVRWRHVSDWICDAGILRYILLFIMFSAGRLLVTGIGAQTQNLSSGNQWRPLSSIWVFDTWRYKLPSFKHSTISSKTWQALVVKLKLSCV